MKTLVQIVNILLFWLMISFLINAVKGSFSSASFYGNSFIFERNADFTSESTVVLQFQTQALNGLILLAAGQQDYFIVSLRNGQIEVRMDAGAGEVVLQSPDSIKYNDLLWHEVVILRVGMRLDLQVNSQDVASASAGVLGDDDRLDIDLGIFLGGYDLSVGASYLDKTVPFFRGCMLKARFNSADILDPLRNIPEQKIIHNIQAGCSKVLRARRNEPVTFKSTNAYLKYQRWTNGAEGAFECQIRTVANHGLILFNSGWKKQEFVGLEMVGGTIRGSLNRGVGVVGLQSTHPVNDGKWHRIRFFFSSTFLEIRVDKNRTKMFVEQADVLTDDSSDLTDIHLKGPLYVGGIDARLKNNRRIVTSGLKVESFPGCMKNIRANYRPKSFGDILSSHDVSVGCKKMRQVDFQASPVNVPLLPSFVIVPYSAQPKVADRRPDAQSKVDSANDLSKIKKILQQKVCYYVNTSSFDVLEGNSRNISQRVINFQPMSEKSVTKLYNSNPLSVFTLHLVTNPMHGRLVLNEQTLPNKTHTMKKIFSNHMLYLHDGSETFSDSFSFSLGVVDQGSPIREKDAKHYQLCDEKLMMISNSTIYTINITIIPVDDPPILHIRSNYIFRPIHGATTPLPKDIFQATDPDSSPSHIIYHLLSVGAGYFIENNSNPGRPINMYTQEDVNQNRINFVHVNGPDHLRVLIQVSNSMINDGNVRSTVVLRVVTRRLTIEVKNNTGITLVEGEALVLSENHLSSLTNSGHSIVDVQYHLRKDPVHGQMQVLMGTDSSNQAWTVASTFSQSHLREGKIRYLNVEAPNEFDDIVHDEFTFAVSGAGEDVGPFIFNITVLRVVVSVYAVPIDLRGGDASVVLTTDQINLHFTALNQATDIEVQFVIVESFETAAVIYSDTGLELFSGDAFTLSELKSGRIEVVVYTDRVAVDVAKVEDNMSFYGVVQGRYRSKKGDLALTFVPDVRSIKITSVDLLVDEGQETRITKDYLFAETLLHRKFLFRVLQPPAHGELKLRQLSAASSAANSKANVTSFTIRDIVDERLYYRHDGSENRRDSIVFDVAPILEGELPERVETLKNVSAKGTLNVTVTLLNDNQPTRTVNKPFQIVRHGERLVTKYDLWYHDADIDQDELTLKYVRRGISNGDIVNATSKRHEKIFEFTQRDILSNTVMFRHKRPDFGRFVFLVKDGKNFATGLFVVNASDPYVHVINSSKLLVEKGSSSNITTANIQVETNVKGLKTLINYSILNPPRYGTIVEKKNNSEAVVFNFTQQDIDENRVSYQHDASEHLLDSFDYSVTVGSTTAYGNVSVQVYLASQQQPPVMRRNRLVVVEQSSLVVIGRSDLRATHPAVRPRDVTYTVRLRPEYGSLLLNRTLDTKNNYPKDRNLINATAFNQWNVNENQLVYVQDKNLSLNVLQPVDNFTFDVSNGILSLMRITCRIEIVPLLIPLRTANFTVDEGHSKVLIRQYLDVASRHFDHLDITIVVVRQPINGRLESSRAMDERLTEFSLRLALAEFVYYVHDGSDTTQDMFQLQAQATVGSRESAVVSTYVTINPENDQSPQIVNNTGMTVWVNSITPLSPNQLATFDIDSPPSNLTYEILPPHNGYLALKSHSSRSIVNFTQADINHGNVVFVHKGSKTGGFTFQVNDHLNFDVKHIFVITAVPLVISLAPTSPVQVFPSTLSRLTRNNLQSTTNDKSEGPESRDIIYHVTKQPVSGRIVRKSHINNTDNHEIVFIDNATQTFYEEANSFTQSQIDSGLIYFHQFTQVEQWQTLDEIKLTARSEPATEMKNISLEFNITYDAFKHADKTSSVRINAGGEVNEGGSLNITSQQLDATNLFKKMDDASLRKRYDLRYRLLTLPMHGQLFVANRLLSRNDSFLHKFLEQGILRYVHDDSEEPDDFFRFEAYLRSKKQSNQRRDPISEQDVFHINVHEINDNPPVLQNKSPNLEVVQGFVAVFNRSHLYSIDVDNPSSDIIYKLLRVPTYGKLNLNNRNATSKSQSIVSFTQDDIDNQHLLFQQNAVGEAEPNPVNDEVASDAFYFSLSDGYNKASHHLFRIKILPVSLAVKARAVSLQQGKFSASISSELVTVSTNGHVELLTFHVVGLPQAGALYRGADIITSFNYNDLASSRISYVMSAVDHENDHVTLMSVYNDTRLNYQPNSTSHLNITVTPLVKAGILAIKTGGSTLLSLNVLDASDLANLTGSLPVYDVISKPEFAKIFITHQKPSNLSSSSHSVTRRSVHSETTMFTHDDIIAGHVYMSVGFINMTNITSVEDKLIYRLTVKSNFVQPAVGVLPFSIVPPSATLSPNATGVEETTLSLLDTTHGEEVYTEPFTSSPFWMNTTSILLSATTPVMTVPSSSTAAEKEIEIMEVADAEDNSTVSWLIPLIITLSVLILIAIIIIMVCVYKKRREKLGPSYVRGHESAVLKTSVPIQQPLSSPSQNTQQTIINPASYATVTSRTDPVDSSVLCSTVPVIVTPLRSMPNVAVTDDESEDDGDCYDDGYMSNSMPHEGLLSSTGLNCSVARAHPSMPTMPTMHGLGDFQPTHFNDFYHGSNRHGNHAYPGAELGCNSEESIDSLDPAAHLLRRNSSADSLSYGNKQADAPPLRVDQYWV